MSTLGCDCGHVIVDQTDSLPYKGWLLADQDEGRFYERVMADLAALVRAVKEEKRDAWIAEHFLACYPRHSSDAELIHDYLSSALVDLMRAVYECEQCGTVWIERGDLRNRFEGYRPAAPRGQSQ